MHTRIGRFLAAAASLAMLSVGGTATPAAAEESHSNRVLVAVADFADRKHPDPNAMKANAITKYFGAGDSLTSYYRQVSRGRFTFVPAVKEKVIGPLTLHQNAGCGGNGELQRLRQDIEAQVTAKGLVRKRDWDNLSIVLPHLDCYWSGMASIGGRFSWLNTGGNDVSEGTLRHEFGHNLGFNHQIRYLCKDGSLVTCDERAAVAGRSPMGGNGQAGLSASQLIRLGWLMAAEHQKATGSGTFTLRPLYGTQQGTRALEIPMGKDTSLLLEYRRPSGALDTNLTGVYAYRVTGGAYHTAVPIVVSAADHNGAVTELHDNAGKVTVKVAAQGADGATVAVGLNGTAPRADTAPSVPVPPAAAAAPLSGSTTTPQDATDTTDPTDIDDDTTATKTTTTTGAGTPGTPQPTGSSNPADNRTGANLSLASTGSNGTTLTLTTAGGTFLVLAGVFLARRRVRRRRGAHAHR